MFAVVAFLICIQIDKAGISQEVAKKTPVEFKSAPGWVWLGNPENVTQVVIRKEFTLDEKAELSFIAATADNQCDVFINDRKATSSNDWSRLSTGDVNRLLKPGKNIISISAKNDGGPAGILAALYVKTESGKTLELVTDATWKASTDTKGAASQPDFDDSKWSNASMIGWIGDTKLPWSDSINMDALRSSLGSGLGGEFTPEIAKNAQVPPGFKIEKIFQVPRSMGSWVSLTTGPGGCLFASDQGGAGIFMITPGNKTKPTKVERLPVKLSGAHGLVWAFDSLYAVVNGEGSGLHRLRDTDGDGRVDSDEFCMPLPGAGEHGPHAVVLSPDQKSLFVVAGNHTKLPKKVAGSRIPQNWNEDHLLPRRWDANGHAAGILAPGGWICNVDPSGKEWNVYSMGYRNQYDIAFNPDGDLFTYDADMEWDFGSPWYRPTRVCHATSGSEFGWRSGTGKWPTYYEDSLPPAVEIGPGSPTGVLFGTGAKFPAKYQRALFILDWTYSTIYSVELTPQGSSYAGTKADFVTGSPLPVTDAIIGQDGAFYFAAGGRGTQSALYRVSYEGTEPAVPIKWSEPRGADARALRRRLEAFHGHSNGDLKLIFANLGHEDRFIRYAARVALENQPFASWRDSAFTTTEPKAILNAMMAIAHQGSAKDLPLLVEKLASLKYESLSESDQLIWLRVLEVAFARHGKPSSEWREKLVNRLDAGYPSKSYSVNAELVQLLVYLDSPTVIAKTLELMDNLGPEPIPDWGYLVSRNAGYGGTVGSMLANMPPSRAIHFAFMLRNVKSGWTLAQRQKYLQFFIEAAKKPGGNSYAKFLMQFREDSLVSCSQAELIVLGPLAGASLISAPIKSTPPVGPGRKWTTSEALAAIGDKPSKRNFQVGQNLYHATSCSKCHRIGGEGGAIGPDLSTAGKKFSIEDMLAAIIEPSRVISDQYGSQQVLTNDGTVLVGRAVEIGDEYYVYTVDVDAKPKVIKKADVESIVSSKISQMPLGLIDGLNEEELKDLMAYVMSAGDRRARVYRD
ncbi:MAG TPA: c-type cytochrome [Pirellula sp.]|nr:c-type cytochrome [Pirellula sp.]